uniref:Uncharacterized protein n=1 Tax=Plectus sambesii TaxID=2011161 RepID=A0A914WYJ1_9BILA
MTSGAYADRKEIILTQAVDETRRILSDVQPVYDAVRAYELLKNSSNSTAIEKCRLHDPHTILARFEHLVQQQPIALFERLAKGVHYDMMEFYSIALQLINRLSVCAVLTKVCDALRGEKTLEEQQHYQQIAANRLASIHDVLKEQVTALRSDFHEEQIRHDIQVALARPVKWSYGWKTMADTVREKISIKYYHHNWVVMAFESGKENSDVALEFADHRTFFFRLDEYSLVLHAAVADERCSEFAHIFSNGTKLTTLFNSDELFHNILAEEEDLARCASNLKELLLRYNLPADFFIGILQYRPNHA